MKACNPDGKRTGNADLRNCFRRPTNRYLFFSVSINVFQFSILLHVLFLICARGNKW